MLAGAITASVAMWIVAATPNSASAQATPVNLGGAGSFAVLAGSSITNTGATTVTGDVGVSPGATISGLPTNSVNGTIHLGDFVAQQAQADTSAAYTDLTTRTLTSSIASGLGGQTLNAGVYDTQGGVFTLNGTLTLNGQGDPDAVFVIRGSSLTTGAGSSIVLTGGARACNVFFALSTGATLTSPSTFRGNILLRPSPTAGGSIAVGAGVTVVGRLLANGASTTVSLNSDTITRPEVCDPVPPTGRGTTTTLTTTCSSTGPGSPLTVTATVHRAGDLPVTSGQVAFLVDGTSVGTGSLDAQGHAGLPISALTQGQHSIVASYPGSATLDPSFSQPVTVLIGPDGRCLKEEPCDEHKKGEHKRDEHKKDDGKKDDPKTDPAKTDEVKKDDNGEQPKAEVTEVDHVKPTDRKRRHERHDRHRDHKRLVTVQTLHTLEGVLGEHGGGGSHGHWDRWSAHHHAPHYYKHYKQHYNKPYAKKHHYQAAQRPRVAVTG
ncbi:ice-binding family protein [Sphaerisporangium fuscum]|uniref:ice-binding family protein n=1 Tax=Sphaerisporangium fuscum TaxID=2835868 RepID=UPI001BDC443E|nr:ice-binding family protein [Sphaerisporangium fuscum]